MSATDAIAWLKEFGAVITFAGVIASVVSVLLHFTHSADTVERWVDEDSEYRDQLASELRGGGRLGGLYQHALAAALTWLDRRFGAASSSRALGVCIIIALYYAYAALLLAWGVGGPGDIGGLRMLDESVEGLPRLVWSLTFCVLPPIAFFIGRWLGLQERRLKVRLRRRQRWRRRIFEGVYRGGLVAVILAIGGIAIATESEFLAAVLLFGGIFVLGPVAGALAARRSSSELLGGLAAAGAVAIGAVIGSGWHQGAFAGGIGSLAGLGLIGLQERPANEFGRSKGSVNKGVLGSKGSVTNDNRYYLIMTTICHRPLSGLSALSARRTSRRSAPGSGASKHGAFERASAAPSARSGG